ncbi:hypothetical protein LP414_26185 [Polaromonas sp. P1(28)-13]|nr:hypothetical protein LP414_26185 [Polaromonas sp. P1(28)-13]
MTKPMRCGCKKTILFASISLLFGHVLTPASAGSTDIVNVPMAVSNMVTPNVLVIYDNSQSMDAQMNGVMLSGNNTNTRSNIGRSVMRNAITTYRKAFNWGLMSYGMTQDPPTLYSTYSYYLGSDTGMVFTSNCTGYIAGVFNGAPSIPGISPMVAEGVLPTRNLPWAMSTSRLITALMISTLLTYCISEDIRGRPPSTKLGLPQQTPPIQPLTRGTKAITQAFPLGIFLEISAYFGFLLP